MASKKEVSGGVLRYDDTPLSSKFPLVAIITSKLVPNIKLVGRKGLENTEFSILGSHESLQGSYVCAKYLARSNPQINLYGDDALSASKIDQWIERIGHMSVENIGNFITEVNDYLALRTFLVGFNITLADITLFSKMTLVPEYSQEITKKGKTVPHLNRWKSYFDNQTAFKDSITLYKGGKVTVNKEGSAESSTTEKAKPQKSAMGWVGNFDALNLPNLIEGKVCTRFPPEPSGYMHIGHCKAAIINNYYAEKFKGKIVLRFDDTNPEKEKQEYVDNIKGDIETLGIKYCRLTYTSDYFQLIMDYATQLIKDGLAYVDDTPKEKMSLEKAEGIESAARSNTVEKNLELFEEMKKASEFGQKCVLRAKIDMQHVDKAFRDPPIYRCILAPHYRTGEKFKCYPLYDFACPIVDSIEGITHALRSNEYHNKIDQYYQFIKMLKLENKPTVSDYSRLSFDFTVLSKRKLQQFVDDKRVEGWFDPRLPTLQGMMRRGITVEALKEFVLTLGASAANSSIDMGKLWAGNKTYIEHTVSRFSCVAKEGAVPFTLSNGPEKPEVREIPKYQKDPKLGDKKVVYSNRLLLEQDDCRQIKQGEEITLMNWGNAIVETIQTDDKGNVVSMAGRLHLEGDFKKTDKKLTWLSDDAKKVSVILTDYDYIITKSKLDKEDDLKNFMNEKTKFTLEVIADENILSLKHFDKIQFERRGFFNVDKVGTSESPYVLILIPDSKHKPQGSALYPFAPKESKPTPVNSKKSAPAPKKK